MTQTIYKVVEVGSSVKLVSVLADIRKATAMLVAGRSPYWECRCVIPIEEVDTTPKEAVARFMKEQRMEIARLRKEVEHRSLLVRLAEGLEDEDGDA